MAEVEGVDPNFIRFCPIHKLAFDPDPRIYRDAGRCCPEGGERLRGYLERFRDADGNPVPQHDDLPFWEP